jgi:hypothetical protein
MKNLTKYIIFLLFPLTGLMAQTCPDTVKLSLVTNFDGPDFTVDILVDNYKDIVGFQFGLNYDADLLIPKFVTSAISGFNADNFTVNSNGNIRFFWLGGALGETLPNKTKLLTLKFTPMHLSSTGYLEISPKQLPFEFVNSNTDVLCVKADFKEFTTKGHTVSGKLIFDSNDNCLADLDESGLNDWLIELDDNGKKYYRNTKSDGSYNFSLPDGIYSIRVIPRNKFWQLCDDVKNIRVSGENIENQNFLATEFKECIKLKTDISTRSLKRCTDNTYHLVYENQGNITAQDAQISVYYNNEFMQFVGTDHNDFTLGTGSVTFNIGTMDVNVIDTIKVILNLRCDNTIDAQTYCVTAVASPNDPCDVVSEWSGAKLEVDALCDKLGEKVKFTIKNSGVGNMKNPKTYIVTEDDVMRPPKPIQLDLAEALEIELPANGTTYRIFATQDDAFPYDSPVATLALEGCGENGGGTFSTGYVTIFEESDRDLFIDTDCQQALRFNISNLMVASPVGYGEPHYIEKGTNIEYLIRFNNTSGDTLSSVIIRNNIPNTLDITTLQMGASSHPYTYRFNKERDLIITFDQLVLPHDMGNNTVSEGFVKYKIAPISTLNDGDSIKNTARILYNYGPQEATNLVYHVIGTNFIISSTEWSDSPLDIKFYPNPTTNTLIVDTKDLIYKTSQYQIFDQYGRSCGNGTLSASKDNISCDHLPNGIYNIHLKIDQKPIVTVKIVKL